MATGLLGIAGNGDIIGGFPRPEGPEIRRLSPTGALLESVPWSNKALKTGAYAMLIDPTDDSIVAFASYVPVRVTRVSSHSGRVVDTFRLPSHQEAPAIDGQGRIYMYCSAFDRGTCADRVGPYAVVVYSRSGRRLASRDLYAPKGCAFADPAQMARMTDGIVRVLSSGFIDGSCRSSDTRAVDVMPDLRVQRGFEIPYERGYVGLGLSTRVRDMAGTPDGRTYLVEMTRKGGEWLLNDFRLPRERPGWDRDADVGHGATSEGPANPIAVAIGTGGTIWVTDFDCAAGKGHLRWLPPGP